MRADCMYCGAELWGHLERNGICLSCQGAEFDEAADDNRFLDYEPADFAPCRGSAKDKVTKP